MQHRSISVSHSPRARLRCCTSKPSFTPLIGDHHFRTPSSLNNLMPLCSRYHDFRTIPRSKSYNNRNRQHQHQHQHQRYRIVKARCRSKRGQHESRHPHRSFLLYLTVSKAMNEEQRINVVKTSLSQIYTMLHTSPHRWYDYVNLARTIIAHLDSTTFMQQQNRTQEQEWMVTGLQKLAFADIDNGGVPDIAEWCSRQWLVIQQRDPYNLAALRGIGQAWLARAQPTLARIHRKEGSGSSSTGSSQLSQRSFQNGQEADTASVGPGEAERRAGTSDYVEARGFLQPATEYLERAVAAATARRVVSGDLLATTAEAYMSLGNASSPRINERHFRRALQLLRAATEIPGYHLSHYLQQYLDDYGRLLD